MDTLLKKTMINFECLYFLDSPQLCIIEISTTDLLAEVQDHYQWLLINKMTLDVKELQFKAMDASHEIEERFFDLGYLKFDTEKGVYISKEPAAQYPLQNTSCDAIPGDIMEAIARHLNGNSIIFL
ncbi:hypothetical protein ABIE26_005279 [Pedobacter africanus]|uniref:Uncharacterized protein n=1 Tax=Pedobacter africanus TaxID=151894 RepID=A0ACC6L4F6_9SPHI|nr:hypothetical protein [Pedobacter africanus]MDR6786535.1 hypothetical protein [Pedobacter africanus]